MNIRRYKQRGIAGGILLLLVFLACGMTFLAPGRKASAEAIFAAAYLDQTAFAEAASDTTISLDGYGEHPHILDFSGDLLTAAETGALEALATEYGAKQDLEYLVILSRDYFEVTADAPESKRRQAAINLSESIYSEYAQATGRKDCAILTIIYPGASGQNYADVSGQGAIKEKLDDGRADQVFQKIQGDLRDQNFYKACETYIKTVHRYIQVRPGVDPELFLLKLPFQLAIGFAVALIGILIMIHHSGGKITVNQRTFLDPQSPGVIDRYDRFLRKTVSKRKLESSSGGKSGGGHSGGNGGSGSHGGGSF